ncbi:hypothetical protein Pcaca01_38290 [Pectobacterium carotovorum subsp. carotovorum]|nr:hypothetical protein Pcaca01_38290 [Pectobacterium carotovorum subsp. carotovorum]
MATELLSLRAQLAELRGQAGKSIGVIGKNKKCQRAWLDDDAIVNDGDLLYAVPPAASQPYTVPDEMTYADAVNFIQINGMCNETREGIAMRVHNHCRAAMLQSGNHPVIPDGYKLALVPMEHTGAFRSACTVAFEEFNRGTGPCGVFIAGHRAMLSAAPQHKGE